MCIPIDFSRSSIRQSVLSADATGWVVPYPSCYFHGSFGRGGLRERRVSADVHPVVLLGRDVARPAVGRIVGPHVACWLFRQEEGPAPAVAPQVVAGEPALRVL